MSDKTKESSQIMNLIILNVNPIILNETSILFSSEIDFIYVNKFPMQHHKPNRLPEYDNSNTQLYFIATRLPTPGPSQEGRKNQKRVAEFQFC